MQALPREFGWERSLPTREKEGLEANLPYQMNQLCTMKDFYLKEKPHVLSVPKRLPYVEVAVRCLFQTRRPSVILINTGRH